MFFVQFSDSPQKIRLWVNNRSKHMMFKLHLTRRILNWLIQHPMAISTATSSRRKLTEKNQMASQWQFLTAEKYFGRKHKLNMKAENIEKLAAVFPSLKPSKAIWDTRQGSKCQHSAKSDTNQRNLKFLWWKLSKIEINVFNVCSVDKDMQSFNQKFHFFCSEKNRRRAFRNKITWPQGFRDKNYPSLNLNLDIL